MWWWGLIALALGQSEPQEEEGGRAFTTEERLARDPNVLIVRGGASLGSFQAGYLYYLTSFMQARALSDPEAPQVLFDVITGASAGALNTLLTAVSSCQKPIADPEESLFWLWTKVHVDPMGRSDDGWNLFRRDEVGRFNIFSREPFDRAAAAAGVALEQPDRWVDQPCTIDLGFAVTRVRARTVPLQSGPHSVLAPRQAEKVVVRLTRDDQGQPALIPRVPRLADGTLAPSAQLYLHLGERPLGEPVPFDDLVEVLAASSGFPLAFAPTDIPHREVSPDGFLRRSDRSDNALFVDGGVFENLPLKLALRVASWRDDELGAPHPRNFFAFDTDVESWSRARPDLEADDQPFEGDATTLVAAMARSFLGAAGALELLQAIEDEDELIRSPLESPDATDASDHLYLPHRRAVPASQWFSAFLGLFEEDFRVFDFYLGMLEARAWGAELYGDEAHLLEEAVGLEVDSDLFACFRAWDEATRGFDDEIASVPPACLPFDGHGPRGNMVPLLRASTAYRAWTEDPASYTSSGSARFDRWVTLLREHGFHWRTLRDSPRSEGIRDQLRAFTARASELLTAKQGWRGLLLDLGADLALDGYRYRPPKVMVFGGAHMGWGAELGVGVGLGDWLRLSGGLRVLGAIRPFQRTDGTRPAGIIPTPMLKLEATPMRNPVIGVEPWVGYAAELPVTWKGSQLIGTRHLVEAGLHLVAIKHIYVSAGAGYAFARTLAPGFREEALDPFGVRNLSLQLVVGGRWTR